MLLEPGGGRDGSTSSCAHFRSTSQSAVSSYPFQESPHAGEPDDARFLARQGSDLSDELGHHEERRALRFGRVAAADEEGRVARTGRGDCDEVSFVFEDARGMRGEVRRDQTEEAGVISLRVCQRDAVVSVFGHFQLADGAHDDMGGHLITDLVQRLQGSPITFLETFWRDYWRRDATGHEILAMKSM
jgi:hypothetical protein